MGHLLPLTFAYAYPELLHVKTPEMLRQMPKRATIDVTLHLTIGHKVYGEIAAIIHRDGFYPFRVGSLMLFKDTLAVTNRDGQPLELERNDVAVPSGCALVIELDLHIEPPGQPVYVLKDTVPVNDHEVTFKSYSGDDSGHVAVRIEWSLLDGEQVLIPAQLSCPVEVRKGPHGRSILVEYTIKNDAMSFIEFIMTLRRILADHHQGGDHDDILDGHPLLNLSSTRQHPLLAKTHGILPSRWVHVKLQAMEAGQATRACTLVMRGDDLYVHGFRNQHGIYGIYNTETAKCLLSCVYGNVVRPLGFDVRYSSLLKVRDEPGYTSSRHREILLTRLQRFKRCKASAVYAVRTLSGHQDGVGRRSVGEALADLIFMICESARTNPILNAVASGWDHDTGCTFPVEYLMKNFVWGHFWGHGSKQLREWKRMFRYAKPDHHILGLLQNIYLVRDDSLPKAGVAALRERTKTYVVPTDGSSPSSKPSVDASNKRTLSDTNEASRTREQPPTKTRRSNDNNHHSGQEDNNSPPEKPDGDSEDHPSPDATKGRGRPRVELLAVHFIERPTDGTEIIAFDGKRGQIVFIRKELQGDQEEQLHDEQGMFKLLLTGPYTGISAEYGCFTIRIDVPNATDPMKLEWDCDKPEYAVEVDAPKLKPRWIYNPPDGRKIAQVTYAVMSNALEANVEVMLDLKDGHSPGGGYGKITARIDGFDVPSDLFCRTQVTGQCFSSPTIDNPQYNLELPRRVVAVPCGNKVLHIEVDLPIKTSEGVKRLEKILEFNNREANKYYVDKNGDKVEVKISWCPEAAVSIEDIGDQPKPSRRPEAAEMATTRPKQVRIGKRAYRLLKNIAPAIEELDLMKSSPKRFYRKYQSILVKIKIIEDIGEHKLAAQIQTKLTIEEIDEFRLAARIYQLILGKVKVIEEIGEHKLAARMYQQIQSKIDMCTTRSHRPKQTISEEECITSDPPESSHLAETEMSTAGPSHPAEQEEEESITTAESSPSEEVEVMSGNVTEDIEYTIEDDAVSFNGFMTKLRCILAHHPDHGDILDGLSSTREHPVLARNRSGQPARWLRIKLHVEAAGEEGMSSVTLLVQDDNLYCLGFMNQSEVYYELSNPEDWKLPSEYNAVPLDWGIMYETILNVRDEEEVENRLNSARLGKTFAADAVRVLSHFAPAESDGGDDDASARLALAGLIVMVCESAKMNPLQKAIADGWSTGTGFTKQLMEYIGHWELISVALLDWKDDDYGRWTMDPRLAEITGVKSPRDALQVIHLVRNFTIEERQLLHYAIYGSPTDEE